MTTGSISPNDLSARHAVQSIQTMHSQYSECNRVSDEYRPNNPDFIYDQDDEDPDFDPSMPNCDTDTKDPIADAHNIKGHHAKYETKCPKALTDQIWRNKLREMSAEELGSPKRKWTTERQANDTESIIYNGEADWAFTTQGIAYTAGQRHRSSNQVIQIRDVQASQFCIKDLATLDTTVSITGDKELEPTDRIVVGECLLRPASDMLSNREKKKPIATDLDKFDYSVHRCLGTKDTALIVAKIDAKQLNLYQLTNKVDRL
ncbi:hypothetical protein FG05_11895 [Fusarium graminearum]|nr:hypothetical protein FG05_11895 [Fusarium graminearum]